MSDELYISVGRNRRDKKWKVKKTSWPSLLEQLSDTHRTSETVLEYAEADKDRQAEIKDIGGFVGGRMRGGRRLKDSVLSRSIITLDADFADKGFWRAFCEKFPGVAACVYSTHKHTAEKPRLRLVIPLDRDVLRDEFSAISRKIADKLGLDQFDHTSFQFSRMMFWPSTPDDGEFYFKEQKGEFLGADAVLGEYTDWEDQSEWPIGAQEKQIIEKTGKLQGEPEDKPGLIGLFNRAYGVIEAVETFLDKAYEVCHDGQRLTYIPGSTHAGVVIYDNKFAYSHHSTDPACERLCNAFDLVRIHKFGYLDEGVGGEIPIEKQPSYKAMSEFAAGDRRVKRLRGKEVVEAFADVEIEDDEVSIDKLLGIGDKARVKKKEEDADADAWTEEMEVDKRGNYLNTTDNIALILEHNPKFKGAIAYNEFEDQIVFRKNLPWRKIMPKPVLRMTDLSHIKRYLQKYYKITASHADIMDGINIVSEKYKFHPVRDYLNGLEWDSVKRLDKLFVRYLGAANDKYTRLTTRKSLVACVARVMEPGIKFDNVLTLQGAEGQGKSTILNKLGGKWFSDTFSMHMLQGKEAYEQLQGTWIIEISELAGMARAEVERVKGFISAQSDKYRKPYERSTEKQMRQCVFFASTNTEDFLRSQNGNRRFWPVRTCVRKPVLDVKDFLPEERDQIWAEAVDRYRRGETLYLPKDAEEMANLVQGEHTEEDPWTDRIEDFLTRKIPLNWYKLSYYDKAEIINNYIKKPEYVERTKVCREEIWELALKGKEGSMTTYDIKRIKQIMHKIKGWEGVINAEYFGHYGRQRGSYKKIVQYG